MAVAVVVDVARTLVGDEFEPHPAMIVVSAIVTIQLAVPPAIFTTATLRDASAPGATSGGAPRVPTTVARQAGSEDNA